MGGIFFWRKQQQDDEQILASLDSQIRRSEARISQLRQRHQKLKAAWLYYSISFYVFVLVAYFTYLKPRKDPWDIWLWKTGFVVLGAPFIFGVHRFIRYWYNRKEAAEREFLKELKEKQREKVDALKKNESYRKTQLLLERYDSPTKERPAQDPASNNVPVPVNGPKPRGPPNPVGPPNHPPPNGMVLNGMAPNAMPASLVIPPNMDPSPTPSPVSAMPAQPFLNTPPEWRQQSPSRTASPMGVVSKGWFDKVIDVMIGETEGPANKFALICEECFTHNGLVPPQAYSNAKFRCMKCDHFNAPKNYERLIDNRRRLHLESPTSDPFKSHLADEAFGSGLNSGQALRRRSNLNSEIAELGGEGQLQPLISKPSTPPPSSGVSVHPSPNPTPDLPEIVEPIPTKAPDDTQQVAVETSESVAA
ncbi:hypothetical protein PhCBS80983_g03374 [Powellomyces hirtus]|uniref:Endoplasmic reticulum junction formation protein lunapark n=1 Tax=Powellomyces hirtus TaxID=109895 RepID=A0A507E2K8_9FUNG|nr:hypothetical protein PhCBS80983_g03374 [Powellomyces hirtus]